VPIHIEELSAHVVTSTDEVPLTRRQLDQIADHVLCRLAEIQRDQRRPRTANIVRGSAVPSAHGHEEF
jgi:hypothetical protein